MSLISVTALLMNMYPINMFSDKIIQVGGINKPQLRKIILVDSSPEVIEIVQTERFIRSS